MDTLWNNVQLIYDLIAFNFEIDGSKAASTTPGEIVPPELFYRILYWAAQEDTSLSKAAKLSALQHLVEDPAYTDEDLANFVTSPSSTLKCCSLVCRYWANQSRRYLFTDRTLSIKSLENARAFRLYSIHRGNNLIKLCDIIREIRVQQWPKLNESRSLLDLVYFPATRSKLSAVSIIGPFPDTIASCRHDTPHWSITNGDSFSPSITPYNSVYLSDAAFPSFLSVTKYLKHFRAAQSFQLYSLTWNDKAQFSLTRPIPTPSTRPRICVEVSHCTDSFLIGWRALTMYSDSFIHAVVDRDQDWLLNFVMSIRDYYEELETESDAFYVLISDFRVSVTHQVPTFYLSFGRDRDYPKTNLTFIHDTRPFSPSISNRSSPKPVRIVGLLLDLEITNHVHAQPAVKFNTPDLGLLRAQLEDRCALRVVVIMFPNYEDLKIIIQLNPTLRDPWTGVSVFRLAYGGYFGGRVVEIDPTTLEPTGESWMNGLDAVLVGGNR